MSATLVWGGAIWWVVNAYKVKAGIGVIAGKNCMIHAWAPCVCYTNERYINTLTFTFTFKMHQFFWELSKNKSGCLFVNTSSATDSAGGRHYIQCVYDSLF